MDALARRAVATAARVFLAHHPTCSKFERDVVRIGRVSLCGGCVATWPAFLGVLLYLVYSQSVPEPRLALALGLALGVPQVVSSITRVPRAWAAASKLAGGVGLALACWALLAMPWALASKVWIFMLGTLGFVVLLSFRLRRIIRICRACPYRMDWENCAGMIGHGVTPDPARLATGRSDSTSLQ